MGIVTVPGGPSSAAAAALEEEWMIVREQRRVALLRGVNVGTAKRIAMADLRRLFEDLGFGDVRTLLNSGNVVFTVAGRVERDPSARIEKAIADRLGVSTRVTILTGSEVVEAVRANALASLATNPSRLMLMALRDAQTVAKLRPLLGETWKPEALALSGRMAYLWCPNGIIKSRLCAAVGRVVGESGTMRNLATMSKLAELVRSA